MAENSRIFISTVGQEKCFVTDVLEACYNRVWCIRNNHQEYRELENNRLKTQRALQNAKSVCSGLEHDVHFTTSRKLKDGGYAYTPAEAAMLLREHFLILTKENDNTGKEMDPDILTDRWVTRRAINPLLFAGLKKFGILPEAITMCALMSVVGVVDIMRNAEAALVMNNMTAYNGIINSVKGDKKNVDLCQDAIKGAHYFLGEKGVRELFGKFNQLFKVNQVSG